MIVSADGVLKVFQLSKKKKIMYVHDGDAATTQLEAHLR